MMKFPCLFLAASAPLLAQDFLDPLIVTATRAEKSESTTPYTTSVLDQKFLQENTRRTLPEALQYTPGVLVQKTAHGHGSPFIRGFSGRQNLLLVDGVRINNSTYRDGPVQYWNTVDSQTVSRIELIKSQGSVLYGSDAVGGTLNVFTQSSRFQKETAGKAFVGGAAAYEYRSNGSDSHIGRLETDIGIGGTFGILLGLSAKDFGDIKDSSVGLMKNTGYTEKDFDLRADWAATADSTVTLAHYQVNQDGISRWHRSTDNPGWKHGKHITVPGTWTANTYDQERSMTYLRYAGENPQSTAAITRWSATLSYQTSQDSEFQNRLPATNAGSQPIRRANIDTTTTGLDLSLESPVGPGALVYGLDYYHDRVDSSGSRNNLAGTKFSEDLPIADDSTYDLFGVFSQYVFKPADRLEVTAGTRYTQAKAKLGRFAGGEDKSKDWSNVVSSLRGTYTLDHGWSLYGGASQAFRAPNLNDLSGNLTSKSTSNALGSINVDPEKFLTYELGTRHTAETTSVNLAAFYTQLDSVILNTFTDSTKKNTIATNSGDGFIYGVELEGAWQFHPQWTLSGFAAWQEGRIDSPAYLGGPNERKSPPRSLPLSGSLALRWTDASQKFWVESRLLAAATEDRISEAEQILDNQRTPTRGTPGYLVTSVRAGWQAMEHLSLTAAIENLTDEDYRNHGSGQNEPGQNVILGARITW